MAIKPLNSVAGFSVGEVPTSIILANGDIKTINFTANGVSNLGPVSNVIITGGSADQVLKTDGAGNLSWSSGSILANGSSNVSVATANGNVVINANSGTDQQWTFGTNGVLYAPGNIFISNSSASFGILTDNLYYSNGQPWDLQEAAGSNTQIQYNDGANDFGASANFTYDDATRLLTVLGNAQFNNANLGNLVIANYANFANDLVVQGNIANANNISVTNNITSDTANVTGNLTAGNIDGGNLVTANNFSTNGSGGDITLTDGNIVGGNVVIANSFTSNGGTIDFATNNANVQLGSNANVHITGGTSGQVLQTDGAGNLNWYSVSATGIQNGNSNVTIPNVDGNVYVYANGGSSQEWNFDTSGVLITPGNINLNGSSLVDNTGSGIELYSNNYAQLNYNDDVYVYTQSNGVWLETTGGGNVHLGTDGNVSMSGNLSVTGNIANVNNISVTNNITSDTANVTGNLTSGNANLGNLVTANYANFANDLDVGGNIVTGSGSGGNISGVNVLTANTIIGNIETAKISNGTSNIRIDQDGNITLSSNNLSNVFTFTYQGANVIGYVSANGNGTFGAVYSNTVTAQSGNLTLSSEQAGNTNIQLRTFGDGTVDVGNVRITSLATPNASTDAATKQYVDDVAQGLNVHDSALAATANTLANLTGGTITYNNGSSGVGANLVLSGSPTLNYLSANVFDGNVTAVAGSRILVKSEANAATNGIYVVSNSTVLTRALDYDTVPEVEAGDFIFVQDGTTYNDSGWVQTSVVTTIGTDPIVFTQFSGAGTYQAGAGLTLTGTVFSVNTDGVTTEISGGNVIVKANAQLTTPNIGAATGTSLDLTGNLLAGNVNSNATITAVDINLTGNVVAANLTSNAFINAVDGNLTGNLTVGGNITTTGATGNISGANVIFANSFTSNGGTIDFATNNPNVKLGNIGNVHIDGGNSGYVLQTDGAGNLSWTSSPSVNLIQNGNSNVTIPNVDGNVYINANAGTDKQWVFNTDGTLTNPGAVILDDNVVINSTGAEGGQITLAYTGVTGLTGQGNSTWNMDVDGSNNFRVFTQYANSSSAVAMTVYTANADVQMSGNLIVDQNIALGNTQVRWATLTTSAITANQTIATLNVTGVTGIEFLVKGIDSGGGKYSIATVQAVTDGANVDFSTFGGVQLGGFTGTLAVNISGSNISLQVTPASSNSTVWTTQYRVI